MAVFNISYENKKTGGRSTQSHIANSAAEARQIFQSKINNKDCKIISVVKR